MVDRRGLSYPAYRVLRVRRPLWYPHRVPATAAGGSKSSSCCRARMEGALTSVALKKEQKSSVIGKFGRRENDTGSAEVQVALLTESINELTEHLKVHKKDHA